MARFTKRRPGSSPQKKKPRRSRSTRRFPERAGKEWRGPVITYREVELLRKFMTSSCKVMSRKRAGTNAKEQATVQNAIKHARFIGLIPYAGT
jgi:small subunit ribosomal protein S18